MRSNDMIHYFMHSNVFNALYCLEWWCHQKNWLV